MNKIFRYKTAKQLLFSLLAVAFFITGCNKDDGPIPKDILDKIENVPPIATVVNPTGDQSIDILNLESFAGKIDVSNYFSDGPAPEKVDIVVRRSNSKFSTVKLFKGDVGSFPTTIDVTFNDLAGLFGEDSLLLGDNYDFGADIYFNGKKYEAFPATGIGTGAGVSQYPGFSEFARFGIICAYDPEVFQGDFEVLVDEWGDYDEGDIVKITKVSDDSFSFEYLDVPGSNIPIVVKVNTGNNSTSVTKQVYTTNGYGAGYGPISVASTGSVDNFVDPCEETFSVELTHTVAAGSFGAAIFKAKKVH